MTSGSPSPPDDNFEPVDGGVDRVCRGAHENDNFATYFDVQSVTLADVFFLLEVAFIYM